MAAAAGVGFEDATGGHERDRDRGGHDRVQEHRAGHARGNSGLEGTWGAGGEARRGRAASGGAGDAPVGTRGSPPLHRGDGVGASVGGSRREWEEPARDGRGVDVGGDHAGGNATALRTREGREGRERGWEPRREPEPFVEAVPRRGRDRDLERERAVGGDPESAGAEREREYGRERDREREHDREPRPSSDTGRDVPLVGAGGGEPEPAVWRRERDPLPLEHRSERESGGDDPSAPRGGSAAPPGQREARSGSLGPEGGAGLAAPAVPHGYGPDPARRLPPALTAFSPPGVVLAYTDSFPRAARRLLSRLTPGAGLRPLTARAAQPPCPPAFLAAVEARRRGSGWGLGLAVHIHGLDRPVPDPYVLRPLVRVSVVDLATGRLLVKHTLGTAATNSHEDAGVLTHNAGVALGCGCGWGQGRRAQLVAAVAEAACDVVPPVVTRSANRGAAPAAVGAAAAAATGSPQWNETLLLSEEVTNVVRPDTALFFEVLDCGPSLPRCAFPHVCPQPC